MTRPTDAPEVHDARMSRARAAVAQAGLGGLLVGPGPDMDYLIGYAPMPLERVTLLVIRPDRDPFLIVPLLERPAALAAGVRVEAVGWTDAEDPYALAASAVTGGTWALTDQTWSSHALRMQRASAAVLVPSSEALPLLRAVKDAAEIDALRRAGVAADATFAQLVALPFAGRREMEVAIDIDRLLVTNGHDLPAFHIVGSGPNSASPHHEPGERIIVEGDVVVLDFGGSLDGYYSDITRTVVVGEPTQRHREVHAIVHAAQQAAFEAVRPGVSAESIDAAARRVIDDAGYGERFMHRTGHGIGREIHEPPYIVQGNPAILAPGMTFSDEPGIYLDGEFGVRIEDQVVVTESGAERLNLADRSLAVVD